MALFVMHCVLSFIYCVNFVSSMLPGSLETIPEEFRRVEHPGPQHRVSISGRGSNVLRRRPISHEIEGEPSSRQNQGAESRIGADSRTSENRQRRRRQRHQEHSNPETQSHRDTPSSAPRSHGGTPPDYARVNEASVCGCGSNSCIIL
uniref:Secreted protein n=1 Tax=Meloidogyne hapla TaxID=6305 RepID=A0A1I8BEP8_MELHA